MIADAQWMGAAIALADRARGLTWPNPNVGCVIVNHGRVVGRGWTQPGGRPHAEAMALAQAGEAARGATLYTTLEPCAHASDRGPTCSDLIPRAGVGRVVTAVRDPDPRTNGSGSEALAAAGVTIVEGLAEGSAREAMAGFLTRQQRGRPHVTLKLALSLDGCIALADGSSKWITSEPARAHGHLERSRVEVIVVGRGTVQSDNPLLDVRLPGLEDRSPQRVVLSRTGVGTDGWAVLARPDDIATLPANAILVEGGAGAAAAFLAADLVDRLLIYRAPLVIGGGRTLPDIGLGHLTDVHGQWRNSDSRMLGPDRLDIFVRVRD